MTQVGWALMFHGDARCIPYVAPYIQNDPLHEKSYRDAGWLPVYIVDGDGIVPAGVGRMND